MLAQPKDAHKFPVSRDATMLLLAQEDCLHPQVAMRELCQAVSVLSLLRAVPFMAYTALCCISRQWRLWSSVAFSMWLLCELHSA